MINPNQKLNPKLFEQDVLRRPIRMGFGEGLLEAGEKNANVVGLCADLTESTQMSLFKNKFPERFIEMGVAEQNMASVASGMASMGKIPFITSYAVFSPGRNWEQIRTTICYNNVPVKIAGSHAGVSVGPDGGSHQALEDIAITRVLPRMIVISPCDAIEAKKATVAIAGTKDPTYLRLAREKTPIITSIDTPFEIGKAQILFNSISEERKEKNISIFATGSLVYNAILAGKKLSEEGFGVIVVNVSTIKPLDEKTIIEVVSKTDAVCTVEEHQVIGGLGGAISELLSEKYPMRIAFVGVQDKFGQSGKPEELLHHYGLDVEGIVGKVKEVLSL